MNRARIMLLLAWRDAVRHKGRSLLIVALVALPVLVIGAADVLFRSTQRTPEVTVAGELAGSSAYLWAPIGARSVQQGPTDTWPGQFIAADGAQLPAQAVTMDTGQPDGTRWIDISQTPIRSAAAVLPLLPAGSSVTRWDHGSIPVSADGVRYRTAGADLLELTSPAAGGRYRVVAGAEANSGELALTRALATELGVGIGDSISAGAPARSYRVVGLLEPAVQGSTPVRAVVGPADSVAGVNQWNGARYLVSSPVPIGWDLVQQLNSHGVQVYSRAVALDPPFVPTDQFDSTAALGIAAAAILVVLGLTQVVFLSGPAFAIAARKMRRQLGLAASAGAAPAQIAGAVIGSGVLLGVIGSVIGTAVGALVGVWIQPLLTRWTGLDFPAVAVRFGEVALIAGIGAITSVLAAAWPAITALRTDPIAALARRAKPPKRPGIISLLGLVLAGAGVVVLVWSASRSIPRDLPTDRLGEVTSSRSLLIGASLVAVQLGLIIGTPQLISFVARVGRLLPTTPRMALRSAARHRGRSTGAVATILVASTGAVLAAVLISTIGAEMRDEYRPALRAGIVTGTSYSTEPDGSVSPESRDKAEAALDGIVARLWPGAPSAVANRLNVTGNEYGEIVATEAAGARCPWFSPVGAYSSDQELTYPDASESAAAATDPRCAGMTFSALTPEQAQIATNMGQSSVPEIVVGDKTFRRLITGVDDPDADAALAAGKVVVLDRRYFDNGHFSISTVSWAANADEPTYHPAGSAPAVLGRWGLSPVIAIVPPAALGAFHATAGSPTFVVETPAASPAESQSLSATGAAAGLFLSVYVESGVPPLGNNLPSVWLILWIAAALIVGTVLVVTALGVVDADDDSATFASVGASSRLRRTMSGWSALTTTGVGCLLGAVAGLLVAWGVYRLLQNLEGHTVGMQVPWLQLAVLVIALPAVAFGLAAVFTRSKIQLIRRAE